MITLTEKQFKEFRPYLIPCPDIEEPIAVFRGIFYARKDSESVKAIWPETRPYPEDKLPKLFFIDNAETGETLTRPLHSFAAACRLARNIENVVIREYAPTPEEFERLCEEQRKSLRWSRGFGA